MHEIFPMLCSNLFNFRSNQNHITCLINTQMIELGTQFEWQIKRIMKFHFKLIYAKRLSEMYYQKSGWILESHMCPTWAKIRWEWRTFVYQIFHEAKAMCACVCSRYKNTGSCNWDHWVRKFIPIYLWAIDSKNQIQSCSLSHTYKHESHSKYHIFYLILNPETKKKTNRSKSQKFIAPQNINKIGFHRRMLVRYPEIYVYSQKQICAQSHFVCVWEKRSKCQ